MNLIQILIPSLWTLIIIGSLIYVNTNVRFPVTFFSGTEYVKVDTSPALAWSKRSSLGVILGYGFLVVMWGVFILLATDIVTFPEKSSGATFLVLGPTALSVICFFAGYSSRLANNYVNVSKTDFDRWERTGLIKKKGEKDYVDVNGNMLLHAFDNKQWI